jgi:hypothetical protein
MSQKFHQLDFRTKTTSELNSIELEGIHTLFEHTYREADHRYLDASLSNLRNIALALEEEKVVGYSMSDSRRVAIPRIRQKQLIALGGIGCIDDHYRRLGLFSQLANLGGALDGDVHKGERILACGRMAHPASFRTLRRSPTVIPRHDLPLSDWHLEVGAALAELYGAVLKPKSLVVQGSGKPIGHPNIEIQVSDKELLPFEQVNRDEGDSFLGIAWFPDAPPGW